MLLLLLPVVGNPLPTMLMRAWGSRLTLGRAPGLEGMEHSPSWLVSLTCVVGILAIELLAGKSAEAVEDEDEDEEEDDDE